METILNLVWLAVTVAALWLWRFRWSLSRQGTQYSKRMEAVAMVCFLALLFPVISLTDDLHPETVAVDAASGKRNACLIAASIPHFKAATVNSGTQWVAGATSGAVPSLVFASTRFVQSFAFNELDDLAGSSSGRSPPSLS